MMNGDAIQYLVGTDSPMGDAALFPEIGGRYRPLRELGSGGFGRVLLAEDDLLKRRVAVKLLSRAPRPGAAAFLADAAFLAEARMVAKMEHVGIVPIYDVLETDEGEYCIVSRYVEGLTLRERLTERHCTFTEAAEIAAGLCEALHHAHGLGVVHRDVKPANIMLTGDGRPMLLDFGLARTWTESAGEGIAAGTPGYMSPEQARGEDHLVNGRSDIFSLGVVLYEMLSGKRAFTCSTVQEQLDLMTTGALTPPRQVDSKIPKELERICLKAMNPQIRSRYAFAKDMADDLRLCLSAMEETIRGGTHATSMPGPSLGGRLPSQSGLAAKPRVVPRGLRSFDEGDADFFLSLIPGPRDRFGLPESLRFWKQRIESSEADTAFRAGVIYGPSGCGKSSLVRAGLLPRLADHITVLYHEARSSGNTARLGRGLHGKFPQLDLSDSTPAVLIQKLRKGGLLRESRKLLIVIDQAEQWIRAGEDPVSGEGEAFLNTLRQCDGARVQILLLVRDDFWRGVSRLLADADVELDSSNSALVDLFERRHAEMVLESFGRAYRCLPEDPATPLSKSAREFVVQATRSLEQSHRISPVRLALFADMFRSRDWTPETLRRMGGMSGVAVTFLEESFRGPTAKAPLRLHEKAARQVLQLFVPEEGDVRGPACWQSAMHEASGYEEHPKAFQELLQVLDGDLRLLTPVAAAESGHTQPSWQLTHDYMVPALRDWLLARKADTREGRAEIALGERAREWQLRPDPARLPRNLEWLRLRLFTKRYRWTEAEQKWMQAGFERLRWRIFIFLVVIAVILVTLSRIMATDRGASLAERILSESPDEVTDVVAKNAAEMKWAGPALAEAAKLPPISPGGLNARLALVSSDPSHVMPLTTAMLDAEPLAFGAILKVLKGRADVDTAPFHEVLEDKTASNNKKLRAVAGLASLAESDPALIGLESSTARWLTSAVNDPAAWAELLRPIAARLSPMLEEELSADLGDAAKQNAAAALASLHAGDLSALLRLPQIFEPSWIPLLVPRLSHHAASKEQILSISPPDVMRRRNSEKLPDEAEKAYTGYANVLLVGAHLARWEQFLQALSSDADRTLRSLLIIHAASAGIRPEHLAAHAVDEEDPGIRQGLLLALSHFPLSSLPAASQDHMLRWLRQEYPSDPDGGVHSAIATLMRSWSLDKELAALQEDLPRTKEPGKGMGWWVTTSGVDMRIIIRKDGQRFAISACELTLEEYRRFMKEPGVWSEKLSAQSPVSGLKWHDAASYCEWLSAQEGIEREGPCYVRQGEEWKEHPNALQHAGYRLPSKAEWLEATTGRASCCWDFGSLGSLIPHFAWITNNSRGIAKPVARLMPNCSGLWDAHGNISEWCHEWEEPPAVYMGAALGGSFVSSMNEFENTSSRTNSVSSGRPQIGLRLARTLPAESK